jgi:putative hemolysin
MDDPGPAIQLAATAVAESSTDPLSIILKVLLLFVLIIVNAFFAMSEIAIISLNDTKMQRLAEEGNKKAKQIVKLTENSSRFLSTIQIGVTLAGFLTSASASQNFAELLTNALMKTPVAQIGYGVINGVSVVLITIITSYFSLVLGELAPKRIGMQIPEKIAFKVVGILNFVASAAKPFVKVLSLSTNAIVRLFGFDPNADEEDKQLVPLPIADGGDGRHEEKDGFEYKQRA